MNMKKWMIVLLAVLLVVLACGGYFIWKNTSDKSAAAEEKYETFEETEAKLIPVNMSCEDKGFRVTVMGALLTEKYLWIEYDLQDLEGNRLDQNYVYNNAEDWLNYNVKLQNWGKATTYDYSDPTHCKLIQKYRYNWQEEENNLYISLNCIHSTGKTNIPVLPLLEQYGKTYEGMPIPKNKGGSRTSHPTSVSRDDIKVLDSIPWREQPFSDDPEMKNVRLSGIGWMDGQLHIQIHNTDKNLKFNGSFYSAAFQCKPNRSKYHESYPEMATVVWCEDEYNDMDWTEFIIYCQPEDLEELDYYLELTYIREVLKGNWEFNIPLDQIRASAEVASEIDAEKNPEESAKMVYYEVYNGTGEAVMEFKVGDITIGSVDGWDGWKGVGSNTTYINAAVETGDSIPFSYKTESGYEYETTLPLSESIPRTVITMLPKAGGGGINVAYPEPEPTAVPAGK